MIFHRNTHSTSQDKENIWARFTLPEYDLILLVEAKLGQIQKLLSDRFRIFGEVRESRDVLVDNIVINWDLAFLDGIHIFFDLFGFALP